MCYIFCVFSFFFILHLTFDKFSIFSSPIFTNFDHNYQASNVLYHEMFHQKIFFSDLMQYKVKNK